MRSFFILLLAIGLFSCTNESEPLNLIDNQSVMTKAPFNNAYFEWDNVSSLTCSYDSKIKLLPLPWAPGTAQAIGIPESWIDQNLENPDPLKRAYSRENGWVLAYSNLNETTEANKYFALYNKYTGILRFFFYGISAAPGYGTSSTFLGLRINGATGLFNFAFEYPFAMNERQTSPAYYFTPNCTINVPNSSTTAVGYKDNQWYGLEVECAYDNIILPENMFTARIWGANISKSTTTGTSVGSITGNITTTLPNSDPSFSLTINNNNSSSILTNYYNSEKLLADSVDKKVTSGDPFFKKIWSNIQKEVPSLIGKGVKEGINSLFSAGGSLVTKALGKLTNSIFGGSGTSTMTSKVDLGIKTVINLATETTQTVAGWGSIQPFPIPGNNNAGIPLYDKPLGVWNLNTSPIVYIDMNSVSYFYPKELMPYQPTPVATSVKFDFTLSTGSVVLNPEIAKDFVINNLKQEMVMSSAVNDVIELKDPYGLSYGKYIYRTPSTSYFSIQREIMDYIGSTYDPNKSFNSKWSDAFQYINSKDILCRVSFDLIPKNGGITYSFSKYFPVKGYQRTHNHRDEIIN